MPSKVCILGAGDKLDVRDVPPDAKVTRVDIRPLPGIDVVANLQILPQIDSYNPHVQWNLPEEAFDIVIAEHIVEHVWDRIAFLVACRRLLAPNGTLIVEVPSWKAQVAHNTLEHKSTWGRAIFDDGYITPMLKLKLRKVEFRVGWEWYVFGYTRGFWGRMLDRVGLVSAYRFHLRRI
ncbi:MAG: methyltransferase domain-containing protein [Ignavibacteriales bacterium]|nr:methyltransferase domain-containing protein [Ignavibacteriales bacterium]